MTPKPITREDMYMSYIINGGGVLPKPITRRDMYLYYLCVNGFGGEGGSDENYNRLKDELDAMDDLITQNAEAIAERLVTNEALNEALSSYVTKAMMSNQQVNDADRVPTSALAYTMAQGIAANANAIENSLRYRYKFSGDFNNLDIKPGIYFLETSQTWTNGPSPSPAYCIFIQFPAYRFQMIIDVHKIYTRKHTGSPPSWSLWRIHDSGESPSDTLLYQSGEVVCDPGITE